VNCENSLACGDYHSDLLIMGTI